MLVYVVVIIENQSEGTESVHVWDAFGKVKQRQSEDAKHPLRCYVLRHSDRSFKIVRWRKRNTIDEWRKMREGKEESWRGGRNKERNQQRNGKGRGKKEKKERTGKKERKKERERK